VFTALNFTNFLHATFLSIFWGQKNLKPNVIREKFGNLLSHEKRACKMLMKLTPGKVGGRFDGECNVLKE